MNLGTFQAQLNGIEKLLKQMRILEERNRFPNYSGFGAALFSNEPYKRVWEICYAQQYYDFILHDHSLLLFRANFDTNEFHYSYYESPRDVVPYEDFLINDCGFTDDEVDEIGDSFRPDYEQAISTVAEREIVTPVRYDHEPRLYKAGLHPASHLHIGFRSNIRLGTKLVLTPISFFMFVCRQCYPDLWISIDEHDEDYLIRRNVRSNLSEIEVHFWNDKDEWELILS